MQRLDQIPLALLGLGLAGAQLHLPALRRLGANVVLAVDPDRATHNRAAGIRTSTDWHDALDCGARAMVIATPAEHHADIALAALSAGLHVYVEKPMASSVAEAAAVVDAARRSGLVLQVGFAYRFHPLWQRLSQLRRAGALHSPLSIQAEFSSDHGSSDPVLDLAIHHVDLVSWLLDATPATVQAEGPRLTVNWEDGSTLNGFYGGRDAVDRMRIAHAGGVAELDRLAGWRLRGAVPLRYRQPPPELLRTRLVNRGWERSFEFALRAFIEAAAGSTPPRGAGPDAGAASVALTEAIIAARATHAPEPMNRVSVT